MATCKVSGCGNQVTGGRHHIVSKGAGGVDDEYNMLDLCFLHHREFHDHGWHTFTIAHTELCYQIHVARERQGKRT